MYKKQDLNMRKTAAPAPAPAVPSPTGTIECRTCLRKFSAKYTHYNIHQSWPPLCLITTKPQKGLDGLEGTIASDLSKICNIQFPETDTYSKIICSDCCAKLYHAIQFISNVQKNDQIIKHRNLFIEVPFNYNDKIWPKPIQLEKNINGCLGTRMDLDIKEEIISDDEFETSTVDTDGGSVANMDIKIEPEEIMPIKITVNGTISQEEMNAQISTNGCEVFQNVKQLDVVQVKNEPMSEDEEQTPADLPLECMLCAKSFQSISGLKAHVIAHHSYKSVKRKTSNTPSPQKKRNDRYVCVTCRRTFVTSTDLMVHETCHNKAVCYGCSERFDSFEQLSRHRRRCKIIRDKEAPKPKTLEDVMRPPPEELKVRKVKTVLKCSLCTEEFSDAYYMKIHHEIHHSDEKTGITDLDSGPGETINQPEQRTTEFQTKIEERDSKMETELESIFEESPKSDDKNKNTVENQKVQSEVEKHNRIDGNDQMKTKEQTQICQIENIESNVADQADNLEKMLAHCENPTDTVLQTQETEKENAVAVPVDVKIETLENMLTFTDNVIENKSLKTNEAETKDNDKMEADLESIFAPTQVVTESGPLQTAPQITESQMSETQMSEPQICESQISEPQISETQIAEPQITEPMIEETQISESQKSEPQISETQIAEPQIMEPVIEDTQISESQMSEPQISETQIEEPLMEEPLMEEPQLTEPLMEEPQLTEPLIEEPQISESQMSEPQINESSKTVEPLEKNKQETEEPVEEPMETECLENVIVQTDNIVESEPLQEIQTLQESDNQESEQKVTEKIGDSDKIEEILVQIESNPVQESELHETEHKEETQPLQESEHIFTEEELETDTIKALESFKDK